MIHSVALFASYNVKQFLFHSLSFIHKLGNTRSFKYVLHFTAFQIRSTFISREDLLKHNHIFKAAGRIVDCVFLHFGVMFSKKTPQNESRCGVQRNFTCLKSCDGHFTLVMAASKQWFMKSFKTFTNLLLRITASERASSYQRHVISVKFQNA